MYTREQAIKAYLENLDDTDLFDLVVEEANYDESGELSEYDWEPMEVLDTALSEKSPTRILYMASCGDFDIDAEQFRFDGYGNLVSASVSQVVGWIRDDLNSGKYSEILRYFENAYCCEKGDDVFDDILNADNDEMFDDEFNLIDTEDDENE